ncbi:MAG: PDGLE domain-containing protein [Candidatus Planktophila sp.]
MNKLSTNKFVAAGFLVAALLAGGASYYASSHPDGLEKVAEDIGFIDSAKDSAVAGSPLADYGIKGIDNARVSGGLAGILGIVATGAVGGALFMFIRKKPVDKN